MVITFDFGSNNPCSTQGLATNWIIMTGKEYLNISSNTAGIYIFKNIVNNKYYIGQSLDIRRRFNKHMLRTRGNWNYPLYNALNKYGLENFEYSVIEIVDSINKSKEDVTKVLNELEIKYIQQYDSFNNGYNLTIGGDSISGYKFSEESKKNRSKITKEIMNDGRFTIYVYNIKTKEYSEWSSLKEFFRNSGIKSKHIISNDLVVVDDQWIASRTIENLQEKINKLEDVNLTSRGHYVYKNDLTNKELIEDLNNLSWKDFCIKYSVSKGTYYNYRKKFNI